MVGGRSPLPRWRPPRAEDQQSRGHRVCVSEVGPSVTVRPFRTAEQARRGGEGSALSSVVGASALPIGQGTRQAPHPAPTR